MTMPRKRAAEAVEPEKVPAPRPRLCEGVREELERTGRAMDPFTGKTLTREDLK